MGWKQNYFGFLNYIYGNGGEFHGETIVIK